MKHYSSAISLIQRLVFSGISNVKLDLCTCNIEINCFCNLNRVDFGFSLLGKIFKLGYELDFVTFNKLIKGICLDGKIVIAVRFFDEIVEKGFQLDLITYGSIINGSCKIGNTRATILLLENMEEVGSCQPSVVQYNMVIYSLCKDKNVNKVFKVYSDMIWKSITPDIISYNCMIHGVCNLGRWKEVRRLLNEIDGRNIRQTYNILVDTLRKDRKVKKLHEVLDLTIKREEEPDTVTYNALMDVYCPIKKLHDTRKMFDVMTGQGCA